MKYLLGILYDLIVISTYVACSLYIQTQSTEFSNSKLRVFPPPPVTLALLLAVGIPSILQFFFPTLLSLLERDPTRILQGEWWRLTTSLFVQDGGVAGTIFNLVSLLLLGVVAEQFWNSKQVLLLFFVGGILSQFIAFTWQPIGAGNSVANFSLAASIAVACL